MVEPTEPTEPKRECRTCRCWARFYHDGRPYTGGECRRYAPRTADGFPRTLERQWCAEWAAKPVGLNS